MVPSGTRNDTIARSMQPTPGSRWTSPAGSEKPLSTMPVPGLHAQDGSTPLFAARLKGHVYSYTGIASDLYAVEGLRLATASPCIFIIHS